MKRRKNTHPPEKEPLRRVRKPTAPPGQAHRDRGREASRRACRALPPSDAEELADRPPGSDGA